MNAVLTTQLVKAHAKRKSKLFSAWLEFLLTCGQTPLSAEPRDLLRFLAQREVKGKTRVHVPTCPQIGLSPKSQTCPCPKRLRAKTVQGMVSQINVQYEHLYGAGVRSPGRHHSIRMFIDGLFQEQAKGRVLARQAEPLYLVKLRSMLTYLRGKAHSADISEPERFNCLRDIAFFSMQYFAGDRCSDLLDTLTQDVKIVPRKGFRVTHYWGKTQRGKTAPSTFTVPVISEQAICPIRAVKNYVEGAASMRVDISLGPLFRQADLAGNVPPVRAKYDNMHYRLTKALSTLGLNEGETPHSLRAGSAVSLQAMGGNALEIMQHIGWSNSQMLEHYARTAACASATLAANIATKHAEGKAEEAKQAMAYTSLKHAF